MTSLGQHAVLSLSSPVRSRLSFSHRVCLVKFTTGHPDSYNPATESLFKLSHTICYRQSIRLILSSVHTKTVNQSCS